MSLKPPSLWIEQRGHQHRVYWRTGVAGLPARSYVPFYGRAEAEQFVGMAGLLGLDTARQVLEADDPHTATVLLQEALAQRSLAPADRATAPLAPADSPLSAGPAGAPSDPRLTGVTFRRLWQTFLDRHRNIAEGTHELYESYGEYHLLPYFGDTDIGLILRTEPLRTNDAPPGA